MLEAALYSSFLYDCFGFLMKQGHILKEKIITHIREYLCDNRMRMLMNDFCNFKHTGEALLGGFRIVTPKWTPFWVRITGQEVLKDELQKLKGQQADLRKAMRQNRKEARNATKRKNRLVKALRKFLKVKAFSSRRERTFVQTVQRLTLYCLLSGSSCPPLVCVH